MLARTLAAMRAALPMLQQSREGRAGATHKEGAWGLHEVAMPKHLQLHALEEEGRSVRLAGGSRQLVFAVTQPKSVCNALALLHPRPHSLHCATCQAHCRPPMRICREVRPCVWGGGAQGVGWKGPGAETPEGDAPAREPSG